MKKFRVILVLGILAALLFAVRFTKSPLLTDEEVTEETPEPYIPTNTVATLPAGDTYSNLPGMSPQHQKTVYDYVAPYVDLEKLREYEGSYTMDELRNDGNDKKGLSVSLQSSWILKGSNTPQAGLRMRLNPVTKEYEVTGGEVYLPAAGFGVSREVDEDSGEAQTFLNLKRDF